MINILDIVQVVEHVQKFFHHRHIVAADFLDASGQDRKAHVVGRISRAMWLVFDLPLLFGRGVIRRMCGVPFPCGGLRRTEKHYKSEC